ncbi:MAG TPA: hypothetical protein VFZ91_06340 [Allosphingosinicella sp.]
MAEHGRIPVPLRLCRGCRRFVRWDDRPDCAFCGADLDAAEAEHEARLAEMRQAAEALRTALACRGKDAPPAP